MTTSFTTGCPHCFAMVLDRHMVLGSEEVVALLEDAIAEFKMESEEEE